MNNVYQVIMYLLSVFTSTHVSKTEVLLGKLWLRWVLKNVENNMRKRA